MVTYASFLPKSNLPTPLQVLPNILCYNGKNVLAFV